MTRITSEQITTNRMPKQNAVQTQCQQVEILDPVFEETYTVHLTKKSGKWYGWIPDVPEVACEANRKKELLKTLTSKLREALQSREDAWDKQLEEDIKAGKLDHLREEALEEIKARRVIDL